MFESEESDSPVLRKSMSEDDEWEKEEVHVEEVVLTSSTDRNQLSVMSRFWSWRTRLR